MGNIYRVMLVFCFVSLLQADFVFADPCVNTDGDGLCDGIDLDDDNDGCLDSVDIYPLDFSSDSDGDGYGDDCDICQGNDAMDNDGDFVPDDCDSLDDNSTEWKDTDGDTVGDNRDNCFAVPNPTQADSDNDTRGDACDGNPFANYGSVLDAPHNYTKGISCSSCHSYSVWWQFSPMEQDSKYSMKADAICFGCHGFGPGAIPVVHSSSAMNFLHRETLGTWTSKCVDCHNPHKQEQLDWRGTDGTNLYLVTGKFGNSATFAHHYGQTIISNYTDIAVNNEDWQLPSTWGRKDSYSFANGLILVQDTVNALNTFEIISADNSTITVKGGIDPNEAANKSFGLIYGRLIRSKIDTPNSGEKDVKYFGVTAGSYTDDNATGLCQACHKYTHYWANTGEYKGHYEFEDCSRCHRPALGFRSHEIDIEIPLINLVGPVSDTVECGEVYSDPGANVADNSFSGLVAKVTGSVDTSTPGAVFSLYYNVGDYSGNNATEVVRFVTVEDTTNPTITLLGSPSVYVLHGDTYIDPGAEAFDLCGVSSEVEVTGLVGSSTGIYELRYDVFDDDGKPAESVFRTVDVGGRWRDIGDGTVMDVTTGLFWLKMADCWGMITWYSAEVSAAALRGNGTCGLYDGSAPGDWRLPTMSELWGLTQGYEGVNPDNQYRFTDLRDNSAYWSSTEVEYYSVWSYYLEFIDGNADYDYGPKGNAQEGAPDYTPIYMLPVRDSLP